MKGVLKTTVLIKTCERCEKAFKLPNVRASRSRELVIQYFPCPHCAYSKEVDFPVYDKQGRCTDCSIPFSMVKHQGRGRCNRCFMKLLRHEKRAT